MLTIYAGPFIRCMGDDLCWDNVQGYNEVELHDGIYVLGFFVVFPTSTLLGALGLVLLVDLLFNEGVAAARDLHMRAQHCHLPLKDKILIWQNILY
jgi:hypothetical protein